MQKQETVLRLSKAGKRQDLYRSSRVVGGVVFGDERRRNPNGLHISFGRRLRAGRSVNRRHYVDGVSSFREVVIRAIVESKV